MRRIIALGLSLAVVASLSAAAAPRSDDTTFFPTFRGFADPRGTGMTDSLRARLQRIGPNDRVQVIVTYDDDGGDSFFARRGVGNFDLKYDFRSFAGFAATVSAAQASALSTLPGVFRVEEDIEVSITLDAANLDFGAEYARADYGVDGSGVTACVIDTGIDPNHEQLDDGGKIVGWADFVNNRSTPYDDHGHGTHVSNILAGTGTGGPDAYRYRGVAPGASIIAVKVLNSAGSGSASNIIAGIEYCVDQGAHVISMSLGGAPTDGLDAMSRAVNAAVDNGVVAVISAGNSGDDHETIGTPGAAEKAITVGAVKDHTGNEGISLAHWSSRGPNLAGLTKPDTVAPGVLIAAARAGTSSGYLLMSGTSMAAPYVAGAVALMKEINSSLTPPQVKSLIHTWSQDLGVPGIDNDYGAGLIDVYALVGAAAGDTPVPTIFPVHQFVAANVPNDGVWTFDFEIGPDALNVPIAATILIDGRAVCLGRWWRCSWQWSPDLDAELFDPTGQRLDLSECLAGSECGGIGHQETLHAMPTIAGTYVLRLNPYSGSPNNGLGGSFTVDLSTGPLLLVPGITDDPPTASIMAPADGATVAGNVMVEVDANDTEDDPGALNVEVKLGAGTWQAATWNGGTGRYEYSWDSTSVGDGNYAVEARASDSGANTTNATSQNVTVDNVDDPPTASIAAPANGANVSGAVLIQVDANDVEDAAGALDVEVNIDGGAWQTAIWNAGTSRYEWTWNTPAGDNGVGHTIAARAKDLNGSTTDAANVNVTVDNVDDPPSAAITSPANGANVSGAVLIRVDANDVEDAAGALDVEVKIDGGGWQTATWNAGTSRYEWTWNTPGGDDGVAHTISAQATDLNASTTGAADVNVTVDNVDATPLVSIGNPGGPLSGIVTLQVQASDVEDAAGTLNVGISIDSGGWQTAAWNAGTSRYELAWDTTGVANGGHTIDARATDSFPNTGNATPLGVTVDNVDETPLVSIGNPGGPLVGTVTLQVQASDVEDAAGTLNVGISIDSGGWQTAAWNAGTSRYEFAWDTTGVANGGHTIDARATDSFPNTGNAAQLGVSVDNPLVVTVHSSDLDGTSTPSGSRRWIAAVTIWVHGANHLPVAGANVSGDWSRGSASGNCTTGSDGSCTVSTGAMSRWRRSIAYTVEDITGSTYDPDANHDPDGDSDGTTITLSRP